LERGTIKMFPGYLLLPTGFEKEERGKKFRVSFYHEAQIEIYFSTAIEI